MIGATMSKDKKTTMTARKIAYIVGTVAFLTPITAFAAWTVFDPTAVAKLTETIKLAKEQISKLQEIRTGIQDQVEAIGEATQINIPSLNLEKLTGNLKETLNCTLINPDDFKAMMPSLNMEDFSIKSVCQGKKVYQNILFGSPEEFAKLTSDQRSALSAKIRIRRSQLLTNTTTKSLAFADKQLLDSSTLSESAEELDYAASTAKNTNDRLAVIAKGQVMQLQAQAQTNQLLAMLLKLQASQTVTGLAKHSTLKTNEQG